MLEGPDNIVSGSEATDTFGLPLVPLDEQLRRAVLKRRGPHEGGPLPVTSGIS